MSLADALGKCARQSPSSTAHRSAFQTARAPSPAGTAHTGRLTRAVEEWRTPYRFCPLAMARYQVARRRAGQKEEVWPASSRRYRRQPCTGRLGESTSFLGSSRGFKTCVFAYRVPRPESRVGQKNSVVPRMQAGSRTSRSRSIRFATPRREEPLRAANGAHTLTGAPLCQMESPPVTARWFCRGEWPSIDPLFRMRLPSAPDSRGPPVHRRSRRSMNGATSALRSVNRWV